MTTNTDPVRALIAKWRRQAAEHGTRTFTGNDHAMFANELEAALASAPPSAHVRVDDALVAGAMEAAADACTRHVVCNEAITAALEYALAQQPAAPSGEAVAWAAMSANGGRVVSISLERDEYVGHVVPLYTAPQQPAAVDEAMVERALNAQPFAESRNSGVRVWQLFLDERDAGAIIRAALTAALAAQQQGGADHG